MCTVISTHGFGTFNGAQPIISRQGCILASNGRKLQSINRAYHLHTAHLPNSQRSTHPTLRQIRSMAPPPPNSVRIEEAQKIRKDDPSKAEAIYKEILSQKPGGNEAALREYESALMGLGQIYQETRKSNELAELVKSSTSSLSSFTKAKTAKLGMFNDRLMSFVC